MDSVPKETRVVSVMTSEPPETVAKARDEKDDRLLLHSFQNRLTARDKNPHRGQAVNKRTQLIRLKFHADSISVKSVM